jgi:hypothetical protein
VPLDHKAGLGLPTWPLSANVVWNEDAVPEMAELPSSSGPATGSANSSRSRRPCPSSRGARGAPRLTGPHTGRMAALLVRIVSADAL